MAAAGKPVSTSAIKAVLELLRVETPAGWTDAAQSHLGELLIDHANCEKKAASAALGLTYRYPLPSAALSALSKLAREELRHFEQVLSILPLAGVRYGPLSASRYGAGLHAQVRRTEPFRLLDTLLVGAIVEARSCERFGKLIDVLDAPLADFYQRLLASEARHFETYLQMAEQQAADQQEMLGAEAISARLPALLDVENRLILSADTQFRFHSGVPSGPADI